jgi:multidrug resistance efflux pump
MRREKIPSPPGLRRDTPYDNPRLNGGKEKIPIPMALRLQDLRLKALPITVFLLTGAIAALIWSQRVVAVNMTGVAVGLQAEIRAPQAGVLTNFTVQRFQVVNAGDVVGYVRIAEPAMVEAQLALLTAEVELIRLGMGPIENYQRNVLSRESLWMTKMKERIELVRAQIQMEHTARELDRAQRMFEERIITAQELEKIQSEHDVQSRTITEKSRILADMRTRLDRMPLETVTAGADDGRAIQAAIRVQEGKLRLLEAQAMPLVLVAPITGMIGEVSRVDGERVNEGEGIITLLSQHVDYIIGYVPTPLRLSPQRGMKVLVRSQTPQGESFESEVINVGPQMEDMDVAENLTARTVRTGLPVQVAAVGASSIRPGEIVNLTLQKERRQDLQRH